MYPNYIFSKSVVKTTIEKFARATFIDTAIGSMIGGLAAVAFSAIAVGRSWENNVPLIFIAVLLLIAGLFGARAGIYGTMLAALIFASLLFTPFGSVRVVSDSARSNIGWMLLVGIVFSFLFAPPASPFRRH